MLTLRVTQVHTMHTMKPASPASGAPGAPSARAARRLAKLQRLVRQWWISLPLEARRSHYLAPQIASAVGIPTTTLGPALRALGWRREQVRLAGEQVGIWIAPGAPGIKRPRGRPPVSQPALESTV